MGGHDRGLCPGDPVLRFAAHGFGGDADRGGEFVAFAALATGWRLFRSAPFRFRETPRQERRTASLGVKLPKDWTSCASGPAASACSSWCSYKQFFAALLTFWRSACFQHPGLGPNQFEPCLG